MLLCNTAYSAEWYRVTGTEKFNVLVDLDSVSPRGKYWQAWFRWDYTESQTLKTYPPSQYLSNKELNVFDCQSRTSAELQSVYYTGVSGMGDTAYSWSTTIEKAQMKDVIPETIGETMLRFVCLTALTNRPQRPVKGR